MAHAEQNKVRAAYNRALRLAERRKMMQAWADYLDGLRGVSCATQVTDEPNQRANVSACQSVRAQSQRSFQNSGQKRDTTSSQLELFCALSGE